MTISHEIRADAAAAKPRSPEMHKDGLADTDAKNHMYMVGSATRALNAYIETAGGRYQLQAGEIALLPMQYLHCSSDQFPSHPGVPWYFGRMHVRHKWPSQYP